jgi:hypothetical protein
MPSEYIEIIVVIFASSVIREGAGKLVRIDLPSITLVPLLQSLLHREPLIGGWLGF